MVESFVLLCLCREMQLANKRHHRLALLDSDVERAARRRNPVAALSVTSGGDKQGRVSDQDVRGVWIPLSGKRRLECSEATSIGLRWGRYVEKGAVRSALRIFRANKCDRRVMDRLMRVRIGDSDRHGEFTATIPDVNCRLLRRTRNGRCDEGGDC